MSQRKPSLIFHLLLSSALLLPFSAVGAEPRPWRISDLYEAESFAPVAVSPAGKSAVSVRNNRMRCKGNSIRFQNQMLHDLAGRLQVLPQQGRRHCQRLARVVKARGIGRVNRKCTGRPDVGSCQITDGSVVLRVAQSPGQDESRITRIPAGLMFTGRMDPGDNRFSILRSRLTCCLFRWHFLRFNPFQHRLPDLVR